MPILTRHKTHLRRLHIGKTSLEGLGGFDLTGLENLEVLNLPRWATGNRAETHAGLLAPRLRIFTWTFTSDDISRELNAPDVFQEAEEAWIKGFINHATSRGVPLKEVRLAYHPRIETREDLEAHAVWDRIAVLAQDFKDSGVCVTCKPSKEDVVKAFLRSEKVGTKS